MQELYSQNVFFSRLHIQHAPVNSAYVMEIKQFFFFFKLLNTVFSKEVASI